MVTISVITITIVLSMSMSQRGRGPSGLLYVMYNASVWYICYVKW